ncbi:MAG: histidine kinase dimerization/phospho-acceptor domain-containing protein, partial [Gammaproteobacteria bacterium]|nr:histidine kinase dimerization/phospho-acceptor domain-containing protein [Gammaproteobacteria bacterium]
MAGDHDPHHDDPPAGKSPAAVDWHATSGPEGVDESTWIDVIRKMDQVYTDLLRYQVELEEKNRTLEETQQFIDNVLGSMSDVMVVCDRNGAILDVNHALCAMVGEPSAALRGRPVAELFADAASQAKAREIPGRLRERPVEECEVKLRGRDGQEMPVAFNCSPRHDAAGHYVGLVMIGRSVGELRRAYRELHSAHEQLKQAQQQLIHSEKLASLGRLVAGVAHELNNPISFVLGNVHALRRYLDRIESYLAEVHAGRDPGALEALRRKLRIDFLLGDLEPLLDGTIEGAERTRSIVDGLKRFSAVDREEDAPFDLVEVVDRAVNWVSKASKREIALEFVLPERLPTRGSAAQVQQVVTNLVQNAIDAMAAAADPRLKVTGRLAGDRAEVLFHDNGPGMSEAVLNRLFDPFFTTKPVGEGTGLGLSISYGIVERYGGQLTARN